MELKILSKVEKPINEFILTVSWINGDSNGYQEVHFYVSKYSYDENIKVRNMFHEIIDSVLNKDSKFYSKYFDSEEIDEEESELFEKYFDVYEGICINTPSDYNYSKSNLDGCYLSYFDKDGIEFNVEVIK